jgi:ribosomal protein L18E
VNAKWGRDEHFYLNIYRISEHFVDNRVILIPATATTTDDSARYTGSVSRLNSFE